MKETRAKFLGQILYPINTNTILIVAAILVGIGLGYNAQTFLSVDSCLDQGGVWLNKWHQCDHDGSMQRQYCDALTIEEYKEFRCDARLGR